MEKNKINKFDLSAAFKALDEIETPVAEKGIKANRVDLVEHLHAKRPTDLLIEDYYDVGNTDELNAAKDERDAEVAKEKLARIEQIVDLDASSPDELKPSYVGKVIIQCPQCMTLFYKDFADIQPADENSDMVNVAETCQHCGNDSGYIVIGKVDAIDEEDAPVEEPAAEEGATEENTELEPVTTEEEATTEETSEEAAIEGAEIEGTEGETVPAEESLKRKSNLSSADVSAIMNNTDKLKIERQQELVEGLDDIDSALEDHNEYIDYLKETIKKEEQELARTSNEEVKAAIQKRIDAATEELKAALPDAVRAVAEGEAVEETVEEEPVEEATESLKKNSKLTSADVSKLVSNPTELKINKQQALVEAAGESDLDTVLDSKEFKKPVSDAEVRELLNADDEGEELDEGKIWDFFKKTAKKVGQGISNAAGKVKTWAQKQFTGENDKLNSIFKNGYDVYFVKSTAPALDEAKYNAAYSKYIGQIEDGKKATDEAQAVLTELHATDADVASKQADKEHYTTYDAAKNRSSMSKDENIACVVITSAEAVDPLGGPLLIARFENDKALVDLAHTIGDKYIENNHEEEVRNDNTEEARAQLPPGWNTKEIPGGLTFKTGPLDITLSDTAITNLGDAFAKAEEVSSQDGVGAISVIGKDKDGNAVEVAKFEKGKRKTADSVVSQFFSNLAESLNCETIDLEQNLDDLDETSLNEHINKYLAAIYENVENFTIKECSINNNNLIVEGVIKYKSGKLLENRFSFTPVILEENLIGLVGKNQLMAENKAFMLCGTHSNRTLITENLSYCYKIGNNTIKGNTL